MPKFPERSFKDKIAEFKRKESFYEKRGREIAEFIEEMLKVKHVCHLSIIYTYFIDRAADEISRERAG